jgi:hypothetical protein
MEWEMKKHENIFIGLITLATLVACSGETPVSSNASADQDAPHLSAIENDAVAANGKTAHELLTEAIPSESELMSEVLRNRNSDPATMSKVSLAPGLPEFSFMSVVDSFKMYDAITGELLDDNDLAELGDYAIIDINVYYEEYGENPIVVEGLLRFYYVYDGSQLQVTDVEFEVRAVTATIEGSVVNFIRHTLDPTDPNQFLIGVTVIVSTTDPLLGTIERAGATDDSGHYSIEVFAGYDYTITGYAPNFENGDGGTVYADANEIVTTSFHMWPISNDSADFGIFPIRGYVYDLADNIVDGAIVKAIDPNTGEVIIASAVTTSDENGYWQLMMPEGVTDLAITADYNSVATLEEVSWPTTDAIDLIVPGAAPSCTELQVNSLASYEEEMILTLVAENAMDGLLVYYFESPGGGSFPLGPQGYSDWTILILPPDDEDALSEYTVFGTATNTFGSCSSGATIEIFSFF